LSVTDAINGIQNGTNAYTYDILNRVTKLTQSGTGVTSKRVDMTYNAVNQIATLNRYGDLTGTSAVANSSYTYDLAGRLTNLTHKYGANTLANYGLTYDAANRIIQSAVTDGTQDYSYDSTNQLTTADHTTQTDEAYSYDANGNRTNAGYGTGTNNQLLTDGTYNYEYDGEGNRTKRTEIGTGKVTEYVWDYRNRLTSVLFKDASGAVTKTIEYLYDVNDRRIGKQIDGVVTERYVYDGLHIALVFDGTGTQTHRYLYGTQIDQVLADERGGIVVWALSDNQGTVRDVMDGNGMILNHVVYDSYGQVVGQSDATVEFRYGYTGREQDNETGLDYYRARYYDAGNGRFISEDPIGFSAGDSNLTRYVENSPTNFTDPSGLQPNQTNAGTVEGFIKTMNYGVPSKMGQARGAEAERQLNRLGEVTWNLSPATTGPFNEDFNRYIYTKKGGWIDMSHFLFYAGKTYIYYQDVKQYVTDQKAKESAVIHCMDAGYLQEFADIFKGTGSAYSYEDLPSDRFGADFALNYFNPNSKKTLGEQIQSYLKDRLGATKPEEAPNYNSIPISETHDNPLWTNKTTKPMFTRTD
jgi:RHS repeat-associated protein